MIFLVFIGKQCFCFIKWDGNSKAFTIIILFFLLIFFSFYFGLLNINILEIKGNIRIN